MNDLINDYLEKGFGSMNKNDFEVAIFNEILKEDKYKNLSDYKLSVELRIPESKVKRLRYEANLKYQKDDSLYLIKFLEILSKQNVNNEGDNIKLIVTDKSLRQYIKNAMYEENLIVDTSFNTDIVITNVEDLKKIVENLYGEDKQIELIKKYKNEVVKDKVLETFKGILKDIVKISPKLIAMLF